MDNVDCTDEDKLKEAAGIMGQNIFFVNFQKIQESITSKFFCVREIDISRSLPGKITLFASGRKAVAKIYLLSSGEASGSALENLATPSAQTNEESFLTDDQGVIFGLDKGQETLPSIFLNAQSLMPGSKLGAKQSNSLKILEKSKNLGLEADKMTVSGDFLVFFSSPRIIFRLDEKIDIQLASLQLILEKAKIDDIRLEFIDLRFDKPAVKFAPKKT